MWGRFTIGDLRTIGYYLGVIILFSIAMYVLPIAVGLAFGEWEAVARYLGAVGISLVLGSLLRFLRIGECRLNAQQAMTVTGLAWIVLPLLASIPLFGSGHYASYADALFDGVSGLTTTGASVINDLEHLAYADNMFRFMMHLLGGLGLVVAAQALGLFGKSGSAAMYTSEGRSEHVVANVTNTARFLAKIILVFILVATIILTCMFMFSGMAWNRAALHAFWVSISGLITGGFTPTSQSIMYYHSFAVEVVLMVLMFLGSINFMLYHGLIRGNVRAFFSDLETKTLVFWLAVVMVVLAASLSSSTYFSSLTAMLRHGLFLIISAFTTTGFQTITTNEFTTVLTSGAFLVIAVVMAVGGSAGGTSGGIKLNRVGIIFKSVAQTVKQRIYPESARILTTYEHVGQRTLTTGIIQEATTVFVLFVLTYVLGMLAGIIHGYEATQALFESIAMASNGGLTSGIVSAGMPIGLEMVYILEMWAGRLEFITLLALIVKVVISLNPFAEKRVQR